MTISTGKGNLVVEFSIISGTLIVYLWEKVVKLKGRRF